MMKEWIVVGFCEDADGLLVWGGGDRNSFTDCAL